MKSYITVTLPHELPREEFGPTGLYLCESTEPYTKIGLVSSNAKWIKEGMQFDETEFKTTNETYDKRAKHLAPGDRILFRSENELLDGEATVTEIVRAEPGSWSWEDRILLHDTCLKVDFAMLPTQPPEPSPTTEAQLRDVRFKPIHYKLVQFKCGNCGSWH
jgi:hypothetical protein